MAALLASHPLVPGLDGVMHLTWEQQGSSWARCNVPSCVGGQGEALALSEGPSPARDRDALAAYASCPLGLCAKPLWDGGAMTQANSKL